MNEPGAVGFEPAALAFEFGVTKALVDRLREHGVDNLRAELEANPEFARAAAAAVKVIEGDAPEGAARDLDAAAAIRRAATDYQEDANLARFGDILARFEGGAASVASNIAAAAGEPPLRVVHTMAEERMQDWERVDVSASAETDAARQSRDAEALRAVERAISGLLVGADPHALAKRLLSDVAAATESALGFVAEMGGGEADLETLMALGDPGVSGDTAELSAEVACRIAAEGISGEPIFGATAAGFFVAIPLRADGVAVLTLGGRTEDYDARALGILALATAVLAAAIGGEDEDGEARIEAALRRIDEVAGEDPAAARADGLRRNLARLAAAGSGELRTERVDLSAMAREIAAARAKDGPRRTARFDIAEGVSARGDPRLLRMALEDLIGNAWAATAGAHAPRSPSASKGKARSGHSLSAITAPASRREIAINPERGIERELVEIETRDRLGNIDVLNIRNKDLDKGQALAVPVLGLFERLLVHAVRGHRLAQGIDGVGDVGGGGVGGNFLDQEVALRGCKRLGDRKLRPGGSGRGAGGAVLVSTNCWVRASEFLATLRLAVSRAIPLKSGDLRPVEIWFWASNTRRSLRSTSLSKRLFCENVDTRVMFVSP